MGKLQQLRAKALTLRGALALGGAVVVAASMTQVAGTLAAPDEVRTAKLATSTENYFPTPLATSLSCSSNVSGGNTGATVSWTGAVGMRYRIQILRGNNPNQVVADYYTGANSTDRFRASDGGGTNYFRVRIYTVNIASGSTDAARVMSSGYASRTVYSSSNIYTSCPIDNGVQPPEPNEEWENSQTWIPAIVPFAVGPGVSMFTSFMDALNSEELLEPLPEETQLAGLETVPAAAELVPADETTSTAPEPSATESGSTTPREEARPASEPEVGEQVEATSSSQTSTTTTRTSTQPTATTSKAEPTTSLPATTKVTVSPTATTAAAPQVSTTTTTATTLRAGVGDDPISVGTASARLQDVDGQTQLLVTGAGGGEVCTADVPGATRIQSTGGELTVTVDGRTHKVDLATCEID